MTPYNPRLTAVRLLLRLSQPDRRLDSLSRQKEFQRLQIRDRALVMELAYGVERWRGRLDHGLASLSKRPLESLDPAVLWTLRTALYQIAFLRVPDRAAVHQAVESCRRLGKTSAAGFVNGILRTYLRCPPELPTGDSPSAVAIRYSHPEWLCRRYLDRYGTDRAKRLLESNNRPSEGFVWVHPGRLSLDDFERRLRAEGIPCRPFQPLAQCAVVPGSFVRHSLHQEGSAFFMDPGSQAVARFSPLQGRQLLGDFCAAPGGKALITATRMERQARLICGDRSWRRLLDFRDRVRPLETPDLNFFVADWQEGRALKGAFDWISLDVPCSGLGTLRSNPDIRWKMSEARLKTFPSRQSDMIRNAFACLKTGGELLYSTCSSEPEENQGVVSQFLSQCSAAVLLAPELNTFASDRPGDGFYAVRIEKRS